MAAKRKPSSETEQNAPTSEAEITIDIDALRRMAQDVDRMAEEDKTAAPARRSKKGKRTRRAETTEEETDETIEAEIVEEMDPEFPVMITSLVSEGASAMVSRFDWTDPGLHWKQKVGECLARVIHRHMPRAGKYSDIIVLTGYIGMWVLPNVALGKAEDKGTVG